MREPLFKEICIDGKTFYSCHAKKVRQSTYKTSAYCLECDLCMHSIDAKGRFIHKYEMEEHIPHLIYCEFEECPYLEDFKQRREASDKEFRDLMKSFFKKENNDA